MSEIALNRGQTLAQMATVWDLRNSLTSVILGASRASQIMENVNALQKRDFTKDELEEIDRILKSRSVLYMPITNSIIKPEPSGSGFMC